MSLLNRRTAAVVSAFVFASASPLFAHAAYRGEFNGIFQELKVLDCFGSSFSGYTVGGQYLDPNNGVLQNNSSMLGRWQGDNIFASVPTYDMGRWTGVHTSNQRGYYNDPNGSPGVGINCYDVGMLLDTWYHPHRPVPGGGYNNMWGYAWSPMNRPRPFSTDSQISNAHLVLQANAGVGLYWPSFRGPDHGVADVGAASAQAALFAYVRDTTNSSLHPIAIIAGMYDSEYPTTGNPCETPGCINRDYTYQPTTPGVPDTLTFYQNFGSTWFPNPSQEDGVWFASAPINKNAANTQPYVDIYYTEGQEISPLQPIDAQGNSAMPPFFRAHITPDNMRSIAQAINQRSGCVPACYSLDPAMYDLEYAGAIAEVRIKREIDYTTNDPTVYDAGPNNWIFADTNKDQVAFGVHLFGVSIYRGIPN